MLQTFGTCIAILFFRWCDCCCHLNVVVESSDLKYSCMEQRRAFGRPVNVFWPAEYYLNRERCPGTRCCLNRKTISVKNAFWSSVDCRFRSAFLHLIIGTSHKAAAPVSMYESFIFMQGSWEDAKLRSVLLRLPVAWAKWLNKVQ